MAINILSLNTPEATLIRPANAPVAYRIDQNKIKADLQRAKENGEVKDLLQLSGAAQEKISSMEKADSRQKTDYSVDAFFRKDMPKIQNEDGTYSVGGVTFTQDELEKARTVMKAAVEEISAGPGKGTTLDYRDYAAMAIAEASVNKFAQENFNEDQQKVIAKAMQEYNEGLEELQEDALSNMTLVKNDYGTLSNYYGLSQVLDQNLADALNKMKDEISKMTGRQYAKSVAGMTTGVVQTATNTKLINNIKAAFSDLDLNDKAAVDSAMKKYQELVKPAYLANGADSRSINRLLQKDTGAFEQMIEKIRLSQAYKHIDFSV